METLPPEIVRVVSQFLTPQDLARCCAVSPQWREIFDQDWLWKPHCDSALEEPLRTIPSVVEPVFESPEVENSTLSTISKWRLAFMRQNHLWANLKAEKCRTHSPAMSYLFNSSQPFLSDTLILNRCTENIEVWDVSAIPDTLVAETDSSVHIEDTTCCMVLGNNMLLVEKPTSIQLFFVDVVTKSIKLKHEICVDDLEFWEGSKPIFLDGSIFHLRANRESTLMIFDLERGKKIMEVPCPVMENNKGNVRICGIKTSEKSDGVLVNLCDERNYYYYIFSLKQQVFLPGPIAKTQEYSGCNAINKHYVAFGAMPSMTIVDYHTSEVLFNNEGQQYAVEVKAYKDSFIFLDFRDDKYWLKIFSLKTKTLITLVEHDMPPIYDPDFDLYVIQFKIVNDRFVLLFCDDILIASFNPSSQTPDKSDCYVPFTDLNEIVNKSYTRSTSTAYDQESPVIYYYW